MHFAVVVAVFIKLSDSEIAILHNNCCCQVPVRFSERVHIVTKELIQRVIPDLSRSLIDQIKISPSGFVIILHRKSNATRICCSFESLNVKIEATVRPDPSLIRVSFPFPRVPEFVFRHVFRHHARTRQDLGLCHAPLYTQQRKKQPSAKI